MIRSSALMKDAEVFCAFLRRLKDTIPQDTPRVLSPQAVASQRVPGRDTDDSKSTGLPNPGNVLMATVCLHPFQGHRPTHEEAKPQERWNVRIKFRWSNQKFATEPQKNCLEPPQIRLFAHRLTQSALKKLLLLGCHVRSEDIL